MSTYILIPGAWLGSSAWDLVADHLRANGHQALSVTLPGLGERADEATPTTDLDAYVTDLTDRIADDGLDEVILVGHSYGGIVASGVADRIAERLARLVYVDAGPNPQTVPPTSTCSPHPRPTSSPRSSTPEGTDGSSRSHRGTNWSHSSR